MLDAAVRPDDVRDAARVLRLGVVAGAVVETNLPRGVAQELIGKVELVRERRILLDRVERNPEDRNLPGVELFFQVAVPATFEGSTRGVGLRVEPEHDAAALVIGQAHLVSQVIGDGERRRLGAN